MLLAKRVLLGVTGGIAVYKSLQLVRLLTKAGFEVQVVMTQSSQQFVSALSFQALTGLPVRCELFDSAAEAAMGHIELARWADILLIAPATANVMAKLVQGLADDLLSTLYLATSAPVYIAPAMNQVMWAKPVTQRNLAQLEQDGCCILGPDAGEQACGDVGEGRLLSPELLFDSVRLALQPKSCDLSIVITAGPTHEAIDPVRFIGNHSSGKMGYAIAQAFHDIGARVRLVSGPVALPEIVGVEHVFVKSAKQMHESVFQSLASCDIFIGCAAVADYRPIDVPEHKIKKTSDELHLTLVKNPDILAEVAASEASPFCVGFAAETQDLHLYAERKRLAKGVEMMAANLVAQAEGGFGSDHNALSVFWEGGHLGLEMTTKTVLAKQLMQLIIERYDTTYSTKNS